MQLYQPLRAANKPPAEPAVLIFMLKLTDKSLYNMYKIYYKIKL